MWIHVSHFTGTQRILAFRHKQTDNICPFRKASVFETKDVRHGERVSGTTSLRCRYEAVPESMATQRSVLVRELCKEFKTADGKVLKAAAR